MMSTLDSWIADSEAALSLAPGAISEDLRRELLDLTREVAHGVARIAGPLTCYLVGLAVANGTPAADAIAKLREAVPAAEPPTA